MDDTSQVRCCGRPMSTIGVQQVTSGLELHSCPSCGQHAWHSDGEVVQREELLQTLQVHKPPAVRAPEPAAPEPDDADRRAELQRLLSTFQVHGSSS